MTKKDFTMIADVIANTPIDHTLDGPATIAIFRDRDRLATAFMDRLAAINPRFDRETFLTACGMDLTTVGAIIEVETNGATA